MIIINIIKHDSFSYVLRVRIRVRINSSLALVQNYTLFYFVLRQGAGQEKIGIYVKAVVPGSAADVVSTSYFEKAIVSSLTRV